MRVVGLCLFVLTCFGVSSKLPAQTVIKLNDAAGKLKQRTTLNAADQVVRQEVFAGGQLQRSTSYAYNADGQLSEEVSTLYDDHEYDLITQYSYSDGKLAGKLIGNNRSGRWSSEGYTYDEHGHLERIDHFRKDGSLAYQTHFALMHRDTLLIEQIRTKVVLPVDSLHEAWENEVAIGEDAVPEPGEVESAFAKTRFSYDTRGRVTLSETRDRSGQITMSTETRYPADGGRTERTMLMSPFGGVSFAETLEYDSLGRVVRRVLLREETRYRYYGKTHIISAEATKQL